MKQARTLYDEKAGYALSMYVAGVSVECMLRAFKMLRDTTFDERHDLRRLFKASGMLSVDPVVLRARGLTGSQVQHHHRELQAALTIVYDLWSNDYRFASEDRLRAHLKSTKLDRGVKGDILKVNALALLNAAETFHDMGVYQWISSKKSDRS